MSHGHSRAHESERTESRTHTAHTNDHLSHAHSEIYSARHEGGQSRTHDYQQASGVERNSQGHVTHLDFGGQDIYASLNSALGGRVTAWEHHKSGPVDRNGNSLINEANSSNAIADSRDYKGTRDANGNKLQFEGQSSYGTSDPTLYKGKVDSNGQALENRGRSNA